MTFRRYEVFSLKLTCDDDNRLLISDLLSIIWKWLFLTLQDTSHWNGLSRLSSARALAKLQKLRWLGLTSAFVRLEILAHLGSRFCEIEAFGSVCLEECFKN